jgi:HD-GYP domain-containing protein (c-di-GMP phosphodiesterase class II)
MLSIIYITPAAVPFIAPAGIDKKLQILNPEEIISDIDKKITESGSPVFALIFMNYGDYSDLNSGITVIPSVDLTYQYVVFTDDSGLSTSDFTRLSVISELRNSPISVSEYKFIAEKSFAVMNEIYSDRHLQTEYLSKLIDTRQDQDDLISIGRSLSSEKDSEKLLRLILFLSKKITGADAGSIYLVEEDEEGKKRLRFKYSHTFSREIPLEEFTMDLNKKSIAGYVAVTGEILNIPDAYNLPPDTPYTYNSSFDSNNNYICRSMLVVPMRNHAGQIIGVIQLINSKEGLRNEHESESEAFIVKLQAPEDFDKYVVRFNEKYNNLLEAIAGQAAIAIENNRLIKQIQEQFEEFVRASVTAIESRDPATSGHSFRVAEICKYMAHAINDVDEGYLKDINFSDNDIREIEFAALLHDFGKVYIDLSVFTKAKKLYPKDFDNLNLRLSYLYRFIELDYATKESNLLMRLSKSDDSEHYHNKLISEKNAILNKIKDIKALIAKLNEPAVTDEDPVETVRSISDELKNLKCLSIEGDAIDVLTDIDRINLTIKRGSLNPEERREIESHVIHTYNFVSRIPWPPEFQRIPEIALRHHEKINGTGYPDGLKGRESVSIQSRIMSVADIFDALAASDRPYKKAVPMEKTLKILQEEADRDVLDPDVVNLFIEKKIYEKIQM